MTRRADPRRGTPPPSWCSPPPPRPTLDAVQQRVGLVSQALFALRALGLAVEDGDSLARHVGALAGILAEQLDAIWLDLDGLAATAEEVSDAAD
jgi:hypothetical protein